MPPSRCAHKMSRRKKTERIEALVTFMETADRQAMGAKLKEIWAIPQSTITELRLLLTMGADPSCLYEDEYGRKTLEDRLELGRVCEECAPKWQAFIDHALNVHEEMWEKKPVLLGKRRGGLVALCLDGGGMRGLVSIVCLLFTSRRLFGNETLPNCFDWLIGTSTGSVLALNLAKGKTASECFYDYWKMKNKIFDENGSTMSRLLGDQVRIQTQSMNKVLKESFPTQTFQQCSRRLTVPALDIAYAPAKLHIFRNYSFTFPFGAALPDEDINFRDAARASSAAPTYFEPHVMGDHRFVDGSFVANYPLNILFKEYDQFAKHGNPIDLSGVLSIGTGEPAVVQRKYKCGTSIKSRAKNITHVVGQDLTAVEMASDRCAAHGIPFFRISPVGINVRIDQTDDGKLMDMVWTTLLYLVNNLELIDSLGNFMNSIHSEPDSDSRRRSNTVL
ncbi:hypothetical protein WR25_06329 [Diploscapter pachys]|uniref:PNPLA domain-containing protein n=1 Tax=Diploscapter pachys TaxID=2018661 RepID=A0A2A2LCL0_9BILA|nr:hypothetical protein WR25_06329 [Diploscapter pachys]